MKNTKLEQTLWLLLAWGFTAGMIFFVTDSAVAASLSFTFTSVVGVFLGIDIAVMLKKTQALPGGEYKEINKPRYILGLAVFATLLAEAMYLSSSLGRECNSLYASFGMGFLIVIGGIMAGIEANKMATEAKAGTNVRADIG
ncbi:MAG: hypothetical protein LBC99_06565 [Spirochaetota bacterium]|jgi:glucan phosphoethanolaminetransferase (alkaline phosphatase superfamily)|nr:hypothetical protein [Spirochaetota bacterium]